MKHFTRSGISLLEVLISMFVLAIGVLSVASLVPVGQSEIVKGGIEDRKGALGQASSHEIISRGWLTTMENPATPTDDLTMFWNVKSIGTYPVTRNQLDGNSPIFLGPVAIDPRSVAAPGNGPAVYAFPYTPGGLPAMRRLTLRTHRSATAGAMTQPLADEVLLSHDDLLVTQPDDETLPAVGQFNNPDFDDATVDGTKRLFETRYSWLFTLVPAQGDRSTLTIVIFRNRDVEKINAPPSPDEPINEVMVGAEFLGGGYGGGLVRLTATSSIDQLKLRNGQYVMMCARGENFTDSNGNGIYDPLDPSVPAVPAEVFTDADLDGRYDYPHFQWYRVINLDEIDTTGTPRRLVGLSGPDWTGPATNLGCAIFAGAIGVYERTVRFEAPSPWTFE